MQGRLRIYGSELDHVCRPELDAGLSCEYIIWFGALPVILYIKNSLRRCIILQEGILVPGELDKKAMSLLSSQDDELAIHALNMLKRSLGNNWLHNISAYFMGIIRLTSNSLSELHHIFQVFQGMPADRFRNASSQALLMKSHSTDVNHSRPYSSGTIHSIYFEYRKYNK